MNQNCLAVRLEDDFLEQYPHASIHTLIAEGADQVTEIVVENWKTKAQQAVGSWGIDPQLLVNEPWVAEWRSAIKKMGLNAAKKRSSIEQLAKRALAGDFISIPIPAVNLYCHVSVMARAPMGGYALDGLSGAVRIRLSRPGDTFMGIGESQAIPVPPNTVVYADDKTVACFAWNHRDSAHTCLTRSTSRAVFFADACSLEGRCRAERAIALLTDALQESGSDVLAQGVLDATAREITVAPSSLMPSA